MTSETKNRLLTKHRAGRMLDQADVIDLTDALRADAVSKGLKPQSRSSDCLADLDALVLLLGMDAAQTQGARPSVAAPAAPNVSAAMVRLAGESLTSWALRCKSSGLQGQLPGGLFAAARFFAPKATKA